MNPLAPALLVLLAWLLGRVWFQSAEYVPRGKGRPERSEKPFRAEGRLRAIWGITADEVMIEGPAGTGKSRVILEYLYALATKNPGIRILIVRKTRTSLTESALVTFEEEVVPGKPKWLTNQKRWVRKSYEMPNDSVIVVGGLDNADWFMSTQFDVVYVQEAREIEEADWEALTSRLRNNRLSFQMIVGDTNPDGPSHWIKMRERAGKLRCIISRHEDNPVYFDQRTGQLTPRGVVYIGRLDNLTGVRYKRLRLGLWVGAEGLIYDLFDPAIHVVSAADFRKRVKQSWPRDLIVDFGYSNAFAALWSAEDPDGRIFFYRELYGTHRTTIEWAHLIHDVGRGEPAFRSIITDHDRGERLDLENHIGHGAEECPDQADTKAGRKWTPTVVGTTPAIKTDEARAIQLVQARMARASDGYPRLFFVDGMLACERDPLLVDTNQPASTLEEIPRYVWAKARSLTAGEVTLEKPVDRWNHGCDCVRYRVMASDAHLHPVTRMYGRGLPEVIAG